MTRGKQKTREIDHEMLVQAVKEQQAKEAGEVGQDEGIEFEKILKLQLPFRNIGWMANLWQFTLVTKLELNNNSIEKIEGLDYLKNLTWLNLSFNHIETISGLDSLKRLEVLNLLENRISVIENMGELKKLNLFSIANNNLGHLEDLLYLRKLKRLRTLNLYGNPLCKEANFKLFVAGYFPELQYLDYNLLDKATKKKAKVIYGDQIEELKHNELEEQKAMEAALKLEAELQYYKDAFVECLNESQLFKSMFANDPHKSKLHRLPGVHQLLHKYENHMAKLCKQLFGIGLGEYKRREAEVKLFCDAMREGVVNTQETAKQLVTDFRKDHTELFEGLNELSEEELLEMDFSEYIKKINQLCESLMKMEFELVIQFEFEQCRKMEDLHYKSMEEVAVATLEKIAMGTLKEHLPDNLRKLLEDKDLVMGALATGHNNHLLKLDNRETQFVTRVSAWKEDLLVEIQNKEMKRNHQRVSEIHRYVDYLRNELEEIQ
ncbi:dynein regulatory complex subunit 3 [Genypterus blacodes]|uniref:dynein regulatory complex subunit 3 n=1 Tax=Genypterus blacodes TaxID=154954 RepID=UPI003F76AE46